MKDMLLALGAMLLLFAYAAIMAVAVHLFAHAAPVLAFVTMLALFVGLFIVLLWRQGWHWSETTPDPPATSEPHSRSPDSKQ